MTSTKVVGSRTGTTQ